MARTVLEVVMAADPRSLERGFQRGEKATDKFAKNADKNSKKANRAFGSSAKSIAKVATAATGLGAAYLSIGGAKKAISATEDLGKSSLLLARNLGISNQEASRFAAVAKVRGIDIKALSTGFGTLSKSAVAAANGGKSQTASFKALGVSLKDVKAGTSDFTGLITSLSDGFEKTEAGPARTAAAMKLLGKGYQTLGPLISAGSKGLREQLDLADKYGVTLDDKTITSVKDLGKAQREQEFASLGLQIQIGKFLLPATTKLNEVMLAIRGPISQFVTGLTEGSGAGGKFRTVVDQIGTSVSSTVTSVRNLAQGFQAGKTGSVAIVAGLAAVGTALVALKVVSTVTKGFAALNLVMAANPAGLVVVGLAALAAGLYVAYTRSEQFRKTVDTTFAGLKTAAIAVLPTVTKILASVRSAFQGMATVVRSTVNTIRAIINGDFSRVFSGLKGIVSGGLKLAISAFAAWTTPARAAGAAVGREIVGGLKSGASKAGELVTTIANGVRGRLGDLKDFFVRLGKDIVGAIAAGIRSAPGVIGKAIGNAAKGALSIIPGIGDGIGRKVKAASLSNAPGGSSGSLMGADRALAPFARIGASAGLSVSSGKRASGGRTSSGGISYHGSGEALDLAGSAAGMKRTFSALKSRYGSRLAELIHTPSGTGIKNGKPFNYTGAVAADHYDHLHVALDLGRPGPGIGDGPGRGDYSLADFKALWTQAGGPSSSAALAAAVGMAESGGHRTISNRNSDGSIDRGLWQINSVHGAMSTFDQLGNAKAAVKISSGGRNWNPWVAYKNGSYRKFLAAARSAKSHAGANAGSGVKVTSGAGSIGGQSKAGSSVGFAGGMGGAGAGISLGFSGNGPQINTGMLEADNERNNAARELMLTGRANRGSLAGSALAMARYTTSLADDLPAVMGVVSDAQQTYNEAVMEYGKSSAEANAALVTLTGTQQDYNAAVREAALQPLRDAITGLNDDLVRAQVDTPDDKTDDLAVVTKQLAGAVAGYTDAVNRGDSEAIIEFGNQVMSFRGDMKSLQDAVQENTSAVAEALLSLKASIDQQVAIANSTLGITAAQMAKALADMVSGQIVGVGLQGRNQTAGAGTIVRY